MKKCKKCGAPLEGFLYNTIGKLMGIKPSEKDPELCNKCEEEGSSEENEIEKTVEPETKSAEAEEVKPEIEQAPEKTEETEEKKEDSDNNDQIV